MKTRQLGHSELELTVVGLGTWAIGGSWQFGWGKQDFDDSAAAIKEALDTGINWLDTAPIYGCGQSEEVIGTVLKRIGVKPLIATKCGLVWNEKREKISCLKRSSIMNECEQSLKRLQVEVIDLYQMHWPDDEMLEEGWDAMATLVKQGKVRYIGASNFSTEQLKRAGKIYPVSSLQPPYNLFRRDIEKELTGYCSKNGIGIVAYSPMQLGLLTGKFDAERVKNLPEGDHRRNRPEFNEPQLSANIRLVEGLKKIAALDGKTVAQLAIAWVICNEAITSAIVGARRSGQIQETAAASDYELSQERKQQIDELVEQRNKEIEQ